MATASDAAVDAAQTATDASTTNDAAAQPDSGDPFDRRHDWPGKQVVCIDTTSDTPYSHLLLVFRWADRSAPHAPVSGISYGSATLCSAGTCPK